MATTDSLIKGLIVVVVIVVLYFVGTHIKGAMERLLGTVGIIVTWLVIIVVIVILIKELFYI